MMVSKVVLIRGKAVFSRDGDIDQRILTDMFNKGIQILMGQQNLKDSLSLLFNSNNKVGIKINTIGGKKLSTRPEVSFSLAKALLTAGIQQENIIIWDRTNRELRDAEYRLNLNQSGFKVLGTDTQGVGYDSELTSHLNIGSLFSKIQSKMITTSISLAILKDHGMAGVTAGMKNYFGAIHNPNKYHDTNCNPFVAELFETKPIKNKHKLTVLDSLVVQYHRGPSYHARWAKKYKALIFCLDPVAADFIGWQIIKKLRAEKGLPSLREEKREPAYLKTAEKMGLGKANHKEIKIIEEEL
ncbi:MAG: DUF362 domain-containing protein [Candidatus Aminicenantes bacterium]|nr:DUF362 domain-containing protein [Candidatus Aminicenantes bacterium]MBL7082351.1 DUF362 domain-containing protein [Candidatus Aminicenantes bacterium]